MHLRNLFLPLGLIVACALALTLPAAGSAVKAWGVTPYLIATIFLVNGFQSPVGRGHFSRRLFISFLIMSLLSLLCAPLLGAWSASLLQLSPGLAIGLIVFSAMPTTLSSGIVITGVAGGSKSWALLYTIGLNLLALITIPLLLPQLLAANDTIAIDALALFTDLILLVLLPFAAGRLMSKKYHCAATALNLLPSTCVIIIVWASLSATQQSLTAISLPLLSSAAIAAATIHLTLMLALRLLGPQLQLDGAQLRAFVFVGSQKTLPVAIAVLSSLPFASGQAVAACVIFHFIQILLDSLIAARWQLQRATL